MARPAKNILTGEKQAEVETVTQIPIHCPSCKSLHRTPSEGYKTQNITSRVQGLTFNRVTWAYCWCLDCGIRYRVKTFEYVKPFSSAIELKRPSDILATGAPATLSAHATIPGGITSGT